MQVCLVSHNSELEAILGECKDLSWVVAHPGSPVPEASLYIWDFEKDLRIPAEILAQEDVQHLFLADPKHLDSLESDYQGAVAVILKPATPFTIKAFVEMALKTLNLRKQAREANTLRHDRDALLQYVLEVNLKLQEYDQERSNFLARALHDLRAPLTALHGYCGLLGEGRLGPVTSQQRELLERMCHSTSRLGRLASGAFELLVQGRFERLPKLATEDIEECVTKALNDVYPLVEDKNIDVTVQIVPPDKPLFFEAEQIEQVLVNLFENSCRFTQRGGNIEIRGYPIFWEAALHRPNGFQGNRMHPPDAYRIDVLDSGAGVPEDLAEKIFEQYASYSGSLDRSGGGLGLAICKLIITAHHGAIWATPSKDGGRFSFVLPLGPVQVREQARVSGASEAPSNPNLAVCGEARA
ncbi:MAG TPA: ATP-binding protein [Bryobacteraceae bacterium]|nr:ATP-binding protein [Bryobacteraceae bacterium]